MLDVKVEALSAGRDGNEHGEGLHDRTGRWMTVFRRDRTTVSNGSVALDGTGRQCTLGQRLMTRQDDISRWLENYLTGQDGTGGPDQFDDGLTIPSPRYRCFRPVTMHWNVGPGRLYISHRYGIIRTGSKDVYISPTQHRNQTLIGSGRLYSKRMTLR